MTDITARYLAGCDGGASAVRKQLGIGLTGEGNLLELRQALYRCDGLYERIPIGKGRHYHVADSRNTFLIVQDSTKHFTLHGVVEQDADMVDAVQGDHRDAAAVRDHPYRALAAESAGRRQLRHRPRISRRRLPSISSSRPAGSA